MKAQPAGEQTVAISIVSDIVGGDPRTGNGARHHLSPQLQVLMSVTAHRGFSGSPAGGMYPDDILKRDGIGTKGIDIAQVLLGGEWQLRQVFYAVDVFRLDAAVIALFSKVRQAVVSVFDDLAQPFRLELFKIFTRH